MVVVCVICAAMSYVYYQTVVTAEYLQLDADEKVDGVLSSVEMWMCVLLASISVVVVSLTYQHLRSVCCPRPFHICPEIWNNF